MSMQGIANKFTPEQMRYIEFLASAQIDADGKKWTRAEYAEGIARVDETTLWRWQKQPGFWEEVSAQTPKFVHRFVPAMTKAMIDKAMAGDVNAYKVILNQAGLLRDDKPEDNQPRTLVDLVLMAQKHKREKEFTQKAEEVAQGIKAQPPTHPQISTEVQVTQQPSNMVS